MRYKIFVLLVLAFSSVSTLKANENQFLKNILIQEPSFKSRIDYTYSINGDVLTYVTEFIEDTLQVKTINLETEVRDSFKIILPPNATTKETFQLANIATFGNRLVLQFNNLMLLYIDGKYSSSYFFDKYYHRIKIDGDKIALFRNRKVDKESSCEDTEVKILKIIDGQYIEQFKKCFDFDFIEYTSEFPNSWIDVSNNLEFTLKTNALDYDLIITNNTNGKEYRVKGEEKNWVNNLELINALGMRSAYTLGKTTSESGKTKPIGKDSIKVNIHNLVNTVKSQMLICKFVNDTTIYASYMHQSRLENNPIYIDIYCFNKAKDMWFKKKSLTQIFPGWKNKLTKENIPFALPSTIIDFTDKYILSLNYFPSKSQIDNNELYEDIAKESREAYIKKDVSKNYLNFFRNDLCK